MKADSKVVVILEVTTKTLLINLELRLIRSSGSGKLQDAGFFCSEVCLESINFSRMQASNAIFHIVFLLLRFSFLFFFLPLLFCLPSFVSLSLTSRFFCRLREELRTGLLLCMQASNAIFNIVFLPLRFSFLFFFFFSPSCFAFLRLFVPYIKVLLPAKGRNFEQACPFVVPQNPFFLSTWGRSAKTVLLLLSLENISAEDLLVSNPVPLFRCTLSIVSSKASPSMNLLSVSVSLSLSFSLWSRRWELMCWGHEPSLCQPENLRLEIGPGRRTSEPTGDCN